MRLRLNAHPAELAEYGDTLLEQLAEVFEGASPPLAEALRKASDLPSPERSLKYPVLQKLQLEMSQAYAERLEEMNAEIEKVIDEATTLRQSEPQLPKREPIGRDTDHTQILADEDQAKYDQVRRVLKKKGYSDSDFESPKGRLYGKSTNELIELARKG